MVSSNVETLIPPNLLKLLFPSPVNYDEGTQASPTITSTTITSPTVTSPSVTSQIITSTPTPSDTMILPPHQIILCVGVGIIIIGGVLYFLKLMAHKSRKNKRKNKILGENRNHGNGKRNTFISFNNNRSNRLNLHQEKGITTTVEESNKKATAADHLKAIKTKFSQLFYFNDNIDEEERKRNRDFETEGEEELSDLESQDSYYSSNDNDTDISDSNSHNNNNNNNNNKSKTIHLVNHNIPINNPTKLPQRVYLPPSPPISSPSISSPSTSSPSSSPSFINK